MTALHADVLVLGGGLAATWAASAAAQAGAQVVLADKGFCGVSSVMATAGLGQYRRDSGWGAHRGDPAHANESWRMDEVFARAREITKEA